MNSPIWIALGNHLWQSTLFALCVAALVLALRRNGASVRSALWLAASVKFLVPFAALSALGARLPWPWDGASEAGSPSGVFTSIGDIAAPVAQLAGHGASMQMRADAGLWSIDTALMVLAFLWIIGTLLFA